MPAFRAALVGVLVAVFMFGGLPEPAQASQSEAATVDAVTRNQLGKPYEWGATGLRRYDCSGLVYRVFKDTGLIDRIGNKRRTARGYFRWFRDRGLVTNKPRVGDLVAWGKTKVTHIGIFAGRDSADRPLAYSALYTGVARHRVGAIGLPLKGYLRVNLSR
jgi:hypothetical protein